MSGDGEEAHHFTVTALAVRLKNLDEFILDETASFPYYTIYQSSNVCRFCVFISAGRVFSAEEGFSSTIRWAVTAWLVLEEGRLSAWVHIPSVVH